MPAVEIDGIVTRYEVTGTGPALLMFSPGGFGAVVSADLAVKPGEQLFVSVGGNGGSTTNGIGGSGGVNGGAPGGNSRSLRSCPAQNPRPVPVNSTARQSASPPASSSAARS